MRAPFERFKKSVTKDNLWIYILTLLKEKEMYPYEIKRKIEERFGFKPGNVTAYVVFNKLKFGGYIEVSKIKKLQGPERTYYKITKKGKEELKQAIKFYEEWIKVLKT
ncbi:MAG: PadR family transcriptional regulator [Candidatus Aenigmarchaeota archaeon]|nr:PadR family transcriptional regulator [Candidatus Aenigmarchaeota archaeon]